MQKINSLLILCLLPILAGCVLKPAEPVNQAAVPPTFPEVTIQGNRFYVGGEPFLIVGVGYDTGTRPGQLPWTRPFQPEVLKKDFERIREAGFNTIRVWAPMTDEELDLAAEYGLWVIQALWIKPDADFTDPEFQRQTYEFVEKEITRSAKHPNILFYHLLNEPHGNTVYEAGLDNVRAFYREMVAIARRCDPKRFFSYSNCVSTDFMLPDMWDFVAQNAYPYSPVTIEKALGYSTYLQLFRDKFTQGKPLVITEFGLSVSPRGDGRGYGGNTLEQQRDGVVRLWDSVIDADCAGGCAFMWIDGWQKYGDERTHNDHSEEWYGFLEADTDFMGRPRPVYYALKEYNKAILTQPRNGQVFADSIPVNVWAPHLPRVQASLEEGTWVDLTRQGEWWSGELSSAGLSNGACYVRTRGIDEQGNAVSPKYRIVTVNRDNPQRPDEILIRLVDFPEKHPSDQPLPVVVKVTDLDGKPLADRQVKIGRYLHTEWNEYYVEADTDGEGLARAELPALNRAGIASVAAGVVHEHGLIRKTCGDYTHVELTP